MVIVYTPVYNGEKTLRRAMDSVLNQSIRDLVYYVGDNCSTDGTREIIRKYAARDSRVRPIYYDREDGTGMGVLRILTSIERIREDTEVDWLCVLDADDVYEPNFLKEMIAFAQRDHLDMAVCGSAFVNASTGKQMGVRKIETDLIVGGEGFGQFFRVYHQFMRPTWAKIISGDVVRKADLYAVRRNPSVGGDTMLSFEFLRHCECMGISSKLLHRYYVSPDSGSYRLDPNRIGADVIQHEDAIAFLSEKVGTVSADNLNFLHIVYFNALKDTLNVLLNAKNASKEEKITGIYQMLCYEVTLEMLGNEKVPLEWRRSLLESLSEIIFSCGTDLIDYEYGVELGLTLSSLLGNQSEYVRFSKLEIQRLLIQGRREEAKEKLSEWDAILPDDPDLAALRKQLDTKPKEIVLICQGY